MSGPSQREPDLETSPGVLIGGQRRKVAIVTGGSRGIGAGLVAAYRRSGWAVVASSRTIEPTTDPAVLAVRADVSDPAGVDLIISRTLDAFGRVDTLINNAGIFVSKPFTDYTGDDYALAVGVNLTGFFWLTQRVIGEMLRHGSGHVVNITSTLADYASSTTPSVLIPYGGWSGQALRLTSSGGVADHAGRGRSPRRLSRWAGGFGCPVRTVWGAFPFLLRRRARTSAGTCQ